MATATVIVSFLVLANQAEWISPRQPLPKKDQMQSVGVYNGKVSILGGELNGFHDLITFDTSSDAFTYEQDGVTPPTKEVLIYGYSQYWTQASNIMYMVDGSYVYTYDLATELFTKEWEKIPVGTMSVTNCIASTSNTLFILGGRSIGSLMPSSRLQIFDISSRSWSNGPNMNFGREFFSCIVSGDKLYAIGGQSGGRPTDTVEYIDWSGIQQNQWMYSDNVNRLSEPLYGMRSVSYLRYVYIIGGVNSNNVKSNKVHMISTAQNVVELSDRLVYGVSYATPVIVGDTIYVFGGSTNDEQATNKWQYYKLFNSRADAGDDGAASNAADGEAGYIGFGIAATLLAVVLIGVVVWKYVCSRKGFKEYEKEVLTKEYGSTVPDEYELAERRL